ncbi:unnamed protein product [Bursaphelenchus okinawaensis]|uniref:Oxidation resistance protein 1 n=1 Tax=Bursaphelenchus okinawaensis TaxID=465554 RepID=A0A811L4H8_9BILA|nr:unnamed protein product [Bursaphelenchus okinawaensis]CAG9116560.1 unnamed protein product [Bursaphelenchus okinawaensis]
MYNSKSLDELLTMSYVVRETDTLEGIAAAHDCTVGELVKLNRMALRMVFPGQKILVPVTSDDIFTQAETQSIQNPQIIENMDVKAHPRSFSMNETCSDGIRKGPGVPAPLQFVDHQMKTNNNISDNGKPMLETKKSMEFDLADAECLQRFLKIKVKQVTESDGTVTGTLLVTPNCLMFDPELSHPLVKEKGSDLYGMVANMEDVVSVSVFRHIADLTGEEKKVDGIYDPSHLSEQKPKKPQSLDRSSSNSIDESYKPVFTAGISESYESNGNLDLLDPPDPCPSQKQHSLSSNASSESQLPCIKEEDKATPTTPAQDYSKQLGVVQVKRRTVSDLTPEQKTPLEELIGPVPERPNLGKNDSRTRCHSELEATTSLSSVSSEPAGPQRNSRFRASFTKMSPDVARRSFGRLSRTLSARANSIKGTVQSGAQTVASGTQKVAHGVVTHTKSAADQIQTGIKTGASAVAEMPQNLVKVGSGLLHDGQNSLVDFFNGEMPEMTASAMKREKSIATLESLREKTKQVREQTAGALTDDLLNLEFSPVLSPIETPQQIIKDANAAQGTNGPIGTPPDPPYYLTVRLDRRRKKKHRIQDESDAKALHQQLSNDYDQRGVNGFGNTRKREFWFAVPRARVDAIYHFLLQWSPDKYGQDVKEAVQQAQADQQKEFEKAGGDVLKKGKKKRSFENDRGFVVLDRDVEDYLTCGKPTNQPFGPHHNINREWEIVTVRELCRRLSLDDDLEEGEMPLPQGSTDSQILDEFMINQVMDILPPRAEGYPWVNIYSSEKHGFSLATLYRRMQEWKEEMSPVLLLIRDVDGHVFGAVASSALIPQDHYYGTGDSSLLFRFTGEFPHTRELRSYTWTGDNQYFINASKDFLSMGAGGGHYGLYLDQDLFNGRSQRCATFNNEPLAGGIKEDFQIQFIEVYGFSMDC